MKIIHTSDWHLGHSLYNYDRSEEQSSFLHQLIDLTERERPDALIVSGDIYHTAMPSSGTQKMFTDALLELHLRCPETKVIITAGNHDSAAKLEIDRSLWHHIGIEVIGSFEKEGNKTILDKHILEIKDKEGRTKGFVLAVPHTYPQNFPQLKEDVTRDQRQHAFFQTLLDLAAERNPQHLPVVLMAHLTITGSNMQGHDLQSIGGIDCFPIEELGSGYDYLALGHIHGAQNITGCGTKARYCGSPLAVSFDEQEPHSVSIVEIEGQGQAPVIRTEVIRNPRPLTTYPENPVSFKEAFALLEQWDPKRKDYIRLNIQAGNESVPDATERIAKILSDKECRFCCIKINRPEQSEKKQQKNLTIDELKETSPVSIARQYYQKVMNNTLPSNLEDMLYEAWKTVQDQEREKSNKA